MRMAIPVENFNTAEKKAHLGDGRIVKAVIGTDCTFIDDWAFAFCSKLKEIWIPEGCRVSEKAFEGSTALEKICIYRDAGIPGIDNVPGADPLPDRDNGHTDDHINVSPILLALAVKTWPGDTEALFDKACDKQAFLEWIDNKLPEYLDEDDLRGFRPFLAGGEEDYGDEITEKEEYVRTVRLNKLRLITERLSLREQTGITDRSAKEYTDQINGSDPVLFFSLFKTVPENFTAYKRIFREYDLYKDIETEVLLESAKDDVEIRAMILNRNRVDHDSVSFFGRLEI